MIDLKKWRIGEYLRELSVIIIGIAITFLGSDLINGINTKKALKQELAAVESELRENEKEIDKVLIFYHDLSKYSDLLIKSRIGDVNIDSLKKYEYTLKDITSFNFKKDAFEMLKYSGRLKEIKDQNQTLNIMECYRLIEQAKETHDTYMNQKMHIFLNDLMKMEILGDIPITSKEYNFLFNFIVGYDGMEEDFVSSKNQINKILSMNISEK